MKISKLNPGHLLLALLVAATLAAGCTERSPAETSLLHPAEPSASPLPAEAVPSSPVAEPPPTTPASTAGVPALSNALKRGCRVGNAGDFNSAGLTQGQIAVDFTLKDIDNNNVSLSKLLEKKPVVMVLGSFT